MKEKSLSDCRKRVRIGYMDGTDFDEELGEALGGNKVYPDLKDCMDNNECVDECGVIKVEIRAIEVIYERNELKNERNS